MFSAEMALTKRFNSVYAGFQFEGVTTFDIIELARKSASQRVCRKSAGNCKNSKVAEFLPGLRSASFKPK